MALSRVSWPAWEEAVVLRAVERAHSEGRIERCCLQVTVTPGHLERVREIADCLGQRVPLGASVVANPDEAGELLEAGLERVGLSLDAVTEDAYRRVKKRSLAEALAIIEEAAARYPGRIVTHVIAGLGETEEEMVKTMERLRGWGVTIALFAFTPIRGTEMADEPPPLLDSYRRVQVAQYLITERRGSAEEFRYSSGGRIVWFGRPVDELRKILSDGTAFETSGCPGCNRPYYNEPPGGPLYNYPRHLTPMETKRAMEEALSRTVGNGRGS